MKFTKIVKAKQNLSQEEIAIIREKLNLNNWSDDEIYNPDTEMDAWELLTDIIDSDYLTEEQKERAEMQDYEAILGMTWEQFNEKRDQLKETKKSSEKLEKYKEDLRVLEDILDEKVHQLNFSYDFMEQLYSDKYDLEKKIEEFEGKK